MDFPTADVNLLPVGSIGDCEHLQVQYNLVIQLVRKGLKYNLYFPVPAWIASSDESGLGSEVSQSASSPFKRGDQRVST